MTGKRALFEQLVADGVRHVFGNPGTTEEGFLDLLQDYPQIEFMLALHEGVAVSMADAYARFTRRPAFVEVHIAPGLGNALGMLHNARVGNSPLVLYAGQSPTRSLFQEPHLSGPLVDMARPICKWAAEIQHARDVPQALRRAFKVANEPPQGPVFLSLPMDTLDDEADDVEIVPTTYTHWRTRPDPAALDEAASLLLQARHPMLLLGDGVARADAQPEVAAVAERLGAGIITGYASEFVVAASHPLYVGSAGLVNPKALRSLLADCDMLLAVGTPVFHFIFPEPVDRVMSPDTQLIHIDLDSWEIGKNVPPRLGIVGDPKSSLRDLELVVCERQTPAQAEAASRRRSDISEQTRLRRERGAERARQRWDNVPISASRLMHELKAALPPNALVFAEAITNRGALEAALEPEAPGLLANVRGGGIGPGLPGSLGAQLACPERKVVGVCSDGAAMYSITALWTAAHHRIPVTYVMLNNASYRILKLNMLEYLGSGAANRRFLAMDLTDPQLRFDRLAEAMGVPAWRVERPDEIGGALRTALAHPGPSLVDVVLDGSVS
jgi:thiamine pyrophosphate-dependent acetolactate synthase large subunit-like protein